MIKKAMETNESSYDMMVDNRVSVENVTRYAEHNGYRVEVTENEDDFTLKIIKK